MNIFDQHYTEKERKIIIYYYTELLSKLLILNYEFSNNKYNGTIGEYVFNILNKKIKLSEKEKQEIITNATTLIKIRNGIKLVDFNKIEFK